MSFLGKGVSLAPAFTELAGGLLGGVLNSAFQRSQMEAQVEAQKDLWAFQQKNAHQYEVEDLRAAGLNPILSATNSQIASMPAVNTPTSAPYQGLSNGLSNAITSAMKLDVEKNLKIKDQEIASRGLDLEEKKIHLQEVKNAAEIDKIQNDISIAIEDLEIRKELKDASIEEKHAVINKLFEDAEVSRSMAAKLGLEYEELKRRMMYGVFLMQYLPSDARDYLAKHMVKFVQDNPAVIEKMMEVSHDGVVEGASSIQNLIGMFNHWRNEIKHSGDLNNRGIIRHGR